MTQMQQIEDGNGTLAEVAELGDDAVELCLTGSDPAYDVASVSIALTPRQARLLARQLLQMADEQDGEG